MQSKLAAMERWPDIGRWLGTLRQSRPVFHSEADFQQALAWVIHLSDPPARVRLETRPVPGMRLDLLVWRPDLNRYLALELKCLTAAWSGEVNGEQFGLVSQGAQDIRAYDVLKDLRHRAGCGAWWCGRYTGRPARRDSRRLGKPDSPRCAQCGD